MARVLDNYDFTPRRWGIYNWQQWADGRIWQVVKGKDYKTETGFRSSALGYARRNNLTLKTSTKTEQGKQTIVFQFIPASSTKAKAGNGQVRRRTTASKNTPARRKATSGRR